MDSQAPNKVAEELMERLYPKSKIRREITYGKSRIDLFIENGEEKIFVEVKGVTLESDGVAKFPDAPTERGIKHIRELQKAVEAGLDASLCFVVQFQNVHSVAPNDLTHPAFGQALRYAAQRGVNVCAYSCLVTPDSLQIYQPVPVIL